MTPERTNKLLKVLSKRQANLTVVMENVQDPHNVSAVMRTCDAVGIQEVYVLTTKIPRHKKLGYRSSRPRLKMRNTGNQSPRRELVIQLFATQTAEQTSQSQPVQSTF